MSDIRFRSGMTVELIDHMGTDQRICEAARVSTKGSDSYGTSESAGLIGFLMRDRHGSPFEHVTFTWRIEAPIFVWREFMRHRVASYNEESGRYKQLDPVFYIPDEDRKLMQTGKPGAYEYVDGDPELLDYVSDAIQFSVSEAYDEYELMLARGVAKEVARMVLPVNIYSSAYVTMNLRGLMNFLSLRNAQGNVTVPTHPQREIEMVAEQMEASVYPVVPLAMAAFEANGRVSP